MTAAINNLTSNTSRANPLCAKDIMVSEPVCVERSTTIRELARIFEENEISGAPVVDKNGRVIGMVSKTDLIRRCSETSADIPLSPPAYLFEAMRAQSDEDHDIIPEPLICVEDFMTEDPVTVTRNTPAGEVAHLMYSNRFHRVVVIDEGRFPIGIITSLDMLNTYPR